MAVDKKKRSLTGWEKTAITVIVVLIVIILALVFKEELEGYLNIFMDWYGSER